MKLISGCNFKNEECILPKCLKRTSEFVDEKIVEHATLRLFEKGLKLNPVENKWGC
jgi:hypothetical protein